MKPSRFNHVIPIDGQLYLYNAFRRGLYEIEPGVATALARCAAGDPDWAADLPPAWVDLLQAGGFVLDDAVDEHARLRVEREAQRLATHQIALTICPTLDCNFGCPYCFEGDLKPQERMQPGTMDAIVRFIHHLKAPDTRSLSVTWFGGEPLLGMPQIEQLTARLRADVLEPLGWAYSAGMITNGYGLTRKIATTRGGFARAVILPMSGLCATSKRPRTCCASRCASTWTAATWRAFSPGWKTCTAEA